MDENGKIVRTGSTTVLLRHQIRESRSDLMADESHDCNEIANAPGSSACKRKRAEETPMAEETRHLIRESRFRSNLMAEEDCSAIANVPGSSSDPNFSMAEETHHFPHGVFGYIIFFII